MLNYILVLLALSGLLLLGCYIAFTQLVHSLLARHNIRLEKIRFLSLCNLSYSFPKSTRLDPSQPLVHLTVARLGVRIHRWGRPLGNAYVKPLEFYLKEVTVKVFRPPPSRHATTSTPSSANGAPETSSPQTTEDSSRPHYSGRDGFSPAPVGDSLLFGLFSISKNNLLVRLARAIVENVCLIITDAEVIVDDQVQVALDSVMLYSSVFDLSNPDEQRRQQRLYPLAFSALHSFSNFDNTNSLRYVVMLSLSGFDSALVPSKARKRRKLVHQFRGNGIATLSADIHFTPHLRVHNVHWDTQLETLDVFLRPAIHAFYKLRRSPMPGGPSSPPTVPKIPPDLGTLFQLPVQLLRSLSSPMAHWFPKQVDVSASLRQLNVYFSLPAEQKSYSSSSEAPTRERRHTGTLRFAVKTLSLLTRVPDLSAREIHIITDLRCKHATVAVLTQYPPSVLSQDFSRHRRLFGMQGLHLHVNGELTSDAPDPEDENHRPLGPSMDSTFPDRTRVPLQPPYSGNASVPSMASSTGSSAFFGKLPQDYAPPTSFSSQIKTKLTINNPFVDVCLDDLVLWENFVRHVRQTRYAASKPGRAPQPNVSGYTRGNRGTSQHPQSALSDNSPAMDFLTQSPLYPSGYAVQETGPPSDTTGYVIPSVIMELHIIKPVVKLRTPPPSNTADSGTSVADRSSSPGPERHSTWNSPLASEGNRVAQGLREHSSRGSNRKDTPGGTNRGNHTGRPSMSGSGSDSRLLVLSLETNSIHLVSKLHRKAPHKLRAQGIPLPPSDVSPFLFSIFSRLTVDPLQVHLAPSLYYQPNLVIPGVPTALVFTPLATVEDLVIENRTVIDISPFVQSLQPSLPPQSIGLGIWHPGLGISFADHHSTMGCRPKESPERPTLSVLTCESSVRTNKVRVRLTQQQQQWLTWVLPQAQALRERLVMLARAKLPRQHLGSGAMVDTERESSPYTYGSYSGVNTRLNSDSLPQTGCRQERISNRVNVHHLKYSLVLPDVRVEASLSNHVLGLPYRGKNEQFAVHDFVLQFHDIQSSLAWSLGLGKGADSGTKSDTSNVSTSPELPANSSHRTGTSRSPESLSPPSRSIRSFGQSPLASSNHPPFGGSPPEYSVPVRDSDDWLHSLGLQAWTLEGSCRCVRGFIITLPTGSASPPPSPRRLAQGVDSSSSFQTSSPQPFMERVLFLENVRFSTKKTYYVASVASSPELQGLDAAGAELTGMVNQHGAGEPHQTTLSTNPLEGVPTVTATVATNIDLDALHVEYSMSRAYLFILLWVRLKQMVHFLEIDRLTIGKSTSDGSEFAAQESASPLLYPTSYRNTLNPAEQLAGMKRPGSPTLGLRTGGPLGDSPFWRSTSGSHARTPAMSTAATIERPISPIYLDARPHLRSNGAELSPSGTTQSSSSTGRSDPAKLATTYTFAISGAVVSGNMWLPFGCNEFNEDDMAEYLYNHVGQDQLHRLRLLANQVIVLYTRYNGGHTTSNLDSGSHTTGNEADIASVRVPRAHSETTGSDRLSEQKLFDEAGKESSPESSSSHVSDWLVTLQSLQLLGRKTTWQDEDVVGADPNLKSAASRSIPPQRTSNFDVKDTDGAPWRSWGRDLEGAIEKGWADIAYSTLMETPEEVTIVVLESAMIRPTTPHPLVSTLNTLPLTTKSSSTKEPPRATNSGLGYQSEGQRRTGNHPPTFSERQESSVRWTMDPAALASAQSPQEFIAALAQGHLENMGSSPPDSSSTPSKDASGSGLRADAVDPNDLPQENTTHDLICASFGVEIDCQALRFRLPYGYNIAFSIDNINNLVKGSRNLLHYMQQELPSTLVRSNFDQITSQLVYTTVDAALFCMTMHPRFTLTPASAWEGVSDGDQLLATFPPSDRPDTRPRHVSAAPLPSTSPLNPKEARRRLHTLHRIRTQAPLVSEKEWHMAWPSPVTHPKKLPYFVIQARKLSFVVDDDPFETALGRIYRCGLVEQQARLARSAAFRKTACNLQASEDQKHVPENPPTANVDIDAAQERLHQYNSANWIRLIRATMSHPRDDSDNGDTDPGRKTSPFGRTESLMPETIRSNGLNNTECQYPTYVYSPSGPSAKHPPPHGELPSKGKPPLVRAHRRRYTPSSWTHPSIPLTNLTIHNFAVTLGPPPSMRTMHDAAAFIRHTDGCTPMDYLYDILIPLRLHLRMGDTRVTLRNYPLPLLHIPDITKLLSSQGQRGPGSPTGRGGSERRGSRGPLASILSNKRTGPVTRDRMHREKYLKQGMLGSMGETPPFSGGFESHDAYLRQASYWFASNYAQHRGWAPIDGIPDNNGIMSDRSSVPAIEQGGAWEVKGDIMIAESLSGEESVRVIWAPLVLDGVELYGGQQRASPKGVPKRGPEPKIGYVRVHRTVPPPKFFCKLNIRIHTSPRAHSSSQHQHIHLYATPKVNGQIASGKMSNTLHSLYRPPVQLVWDQSVQPCITALSQRMENVTSASVDPSPPIAWWDKMRMLMHGSVRLRLVEPLASSADDNGSTMDPREDSGQVETFPSAGYGTERSPGFGKSSRPASARSPRARGKHPSSPTDHHRHSMRTFTGPGELWLLMRGSRDPYALGNQHVGFLTIWRGNVQIQIGQIQKARNPAPAPATAGATYTNRAKDKPGRTNSDGTSHLGQGGEPRRSRSMSAIIENHDMMVQDVVQICSQEFLFAVPILCENTPTDSSSPDSTSAEPSSAGAPATSNPRVRFAFLPSYRLTKQNQSENGHHQPHLANSELLGYAETIHPSPLLRFEKLLLYLSGGVNFTLGLGFGVNLNVLRQLDTYSQWLFSPTPWLSSQLRTQGGVLLDDSQSVYEDLPTAASFASAIGSGSGFDRNLEPRSTRSSQTSRRTHPVRHYELIMRVPKFATPPFGQAAYDTYLGFRSDHVHMSISLRCSYDAYQRARQPAFSGMAPTYSSPGNPEPKNFIALSTNTINHIMGFTSLFASKMLLPICRGNLFPEVSVKDLKFGKFLKSVKCRLDVANLDLSYSQHLERAESNLDMFKEYLTSSKAVNLEEALLAHGQVMEAKSRVGAMDLQLLAIQQSKVLTVDAVKGTIYPVDHAGRGPGAAGERKQSGDGPSSTLGSEQGGTSSSGSGLRRTYSHESLSGPPSCKSGTSQASAPRSTTQVIARQWVIDDCILELAHIDIRMVKADFHIFSQSVPVSLGIPLERFHGIRLLPRDLERLSRENRGYMNLENFQDLGETNLHDAILSHLSVEPLLFSPRIMYYRQPQGKMDDDPNYYAIALYQNLDHQHSLHQSNATHRRDSRAIQISLLATRLERVVQEIAIQRERQQEMEDYMLNADQAQELVALQTLERVRITCMELEEKRHSIERTMQKLHNNQISTPLMRVATEFDFSARHHPSSSDPQSPHPESSEPSDDSYAAMFKHRFLVHSGYAIWNTRVRDILMKFLYVEESQRALRYFLSMAATKVVRDLSSEENKEVETPGTPLEELNDETVGSQQGDGADIGPPSSTATNWQFAMNPQDNSPLADQGPYSPPIAEGKSISRSRFMQLVRPRKPGRRGMVLNRATTQQYIDYLLQGSTEATVEAQAIHTSPTGSSGSQPTGPTTADSNQRGKARQGEPSGPSSEPTESDRVAEDSSETDFGLLDDLAEYFIVNSIYVEFLNPQVNAALTRDSEDAVILAAERIQIKRLALFDEETSEKDVTNPQDDNEHLVKTRSLFGFEKVQVYAVQKKNVQNKPHFYADSNYGAQDSHLWPMWVPMEVLLDESDQTLDFLEPLVQKTSGLLIYDKANTVRIQANYTDLGLDDRANFVGLHFPELVVTADSRQYSTLFTIINDVLIYSEPLKKKHRDQLNTLTLAVNITDFTGALLNVEFMQASIRKRRDLLQQQPFPSTSFAPLTDIRSYRENHLEYLALVEKLRITMEVVTNVQKQRLGRQQRHEAQGRKVVSRRTSLRIDRILLSMLLTPEQPLCDWHLRTVTFMATSHSDQSVSYAVDINQALITNRLPDPYFYELLAPYTDEVTGTVDFSRQKMIRLRLSELAPVGGISVVEHLEISLFPLRIQMTHEVGKKLIQYLFPDRDKSGGSSSNQAGGTQGDSNHSRADNKSHLSDRDSTHHTATSVSSRPRSVRTTTSGNSNGRRSQPGRPASVRSRGTLHDDRSVMEMKSRASKNKTFLYITLPGARHCLSYQGQKGKNLEDLHGFVFTFPTFEYHNETWSWLELLTQVKKDTIRVALAHTGSLVREKIRQIRGPRHQHVISGYAESIADYSSTSSGNTGHPNKILETGRTTRRQSIAHASPGGSFLGLVMSPKGGGSPESISAARRKRSQSVHHATQSPERASANVPRELHTQHPSTTRLIPNVASTKDSKESEPKSKPRLANPLAAVTMFARKLSKTHHAFASEKANVPVAPTEGPDNGMDDDTVAESPVTVENGSTTVHVLPETHIPERSPSPLPFPSGRRQSVRSHTSSRRRMPSFWESSGNDHHHRADKRDKETEEKAQLLFGSHYAASKK